MEGVGLSGFSNRRINLFNYFFIHLGKYACEQLCFAAEKVACLEKKNNRKQTEEKTKDLCEMQDRGNVFPGSHDKLRLLNVIILSRKQSDPLEQKCFTWRHKLFWDIQSCISEQQQ